LAHDVATPVAAAALLLMLPFLCECSAICLCRSRLHSFPGFLRNPRVNAILQRYDDGRFRDRFRFLLHLLSIEVHDLNF
jgi:hypothetical protein